ncbi:MAG: hypothetical protein ABIT83_11050 [Massilia sp.]
MSRTPSIPQLLALCLFAQLGLAQAQNQAPAAAQKSPSSAPPQLERIEEGTDTPITTAPLPTRKGDKRITEKKDNQGGREVEVKSVGKTSYTMKSVPPGTAATSASGATTTLRPPQWKVLEFDLGKKKPKQGEEAEGGAADAASVPVTAPAPARK